MPGKPRPLVPGFLRLRELEEEADRYGISLSLSGLRRQIDLGKVQPDAWEERSYRPGALFRRDRLAEWLQRAPRRNNGVPTGFTTTYALLRQARERNPKIYLSHLQQFLRRSGERAKGDRKYCENWSGAYSEFHGRRRRLIIPQAIAEEFLQLVVVPGSLVGLFAGHDPAPGRQKTKRLRRRMVVRGRKPFQRDRVEERPPPIPFDELGSRFRLTVIKLRLLQMKKMESGNLSLEGAAYYLAVPPRTVEALIQTGQLKTSKGKVTLESMFDLFRSPA